VHRDEAYFLFPDLCDEEPLRLLLVAPAQIPKDPRIVLIGIGL